MKMAAILVLATFAIFVLIDWILSRNRVPQVKQVAAQPSGVAAAAPHPLVQGFLVPEGIRYHPGHTWALQERRNQQRIGVDEFAAALAGRVEKIELPRKGYWIRQGQKIATLYKNGQKTELVSPTEGEVVEINEEVLKNPALLRQDPYGKGWLATAHVPDEEGITRNLVPVNLVKSWMRDAVDRLYALQPRLAGAVAADGGRPADDLLADIPDVNWQEVTGEFFLTR
jgi:glycine cleavage system H lipoate-binding protein